MSIIGNLILPFLVLLYMVDYRLIQMFTVIVLLPQAERRLKNNKSKKKQQQKTKTKSNFKKKLKNIKTFSLLFSSTQVLS